VVPGTNQPLSAVPTGPNINPNSPTAVTPTTATVVTPQPLAAQTSVQPIETVFGPVTTLPSAFDINGNFVGFGTVPSGAVTAGAFGPASTNVADPSVQAPPPTPLAPLGRSMLFERSIADRTQLPAPARPLGPVDRSTLFDDQLPDPTAASAVNADSAAAVQANWALVRDNRGRVVLGADFNGDGLADRYFNRFPTDAELRSAGIIVTPQPQQR
jgi:hypothetical protein